MYLIQFLLFIFLFLLSYYFIIYPIVLLLLGILRKKLIVKNSCFPKISLIISAYNEESVIKKKIENSFSLDYPKDKLEIIVVSDASTDRTNEIVMQYKEYGIILNSQSQRRGKTVGLNNTVPKATGEIIVFSDANSMYEQNALKNITRNFTDPQIGFVTGNTKYTLKSKNKMVVTTSVYTKIELFIKKQESMLASCVGADGAIFAIRKKLYKPLKETDINDFVIPLYIVKKGYRGILDEEVFCFEDSARNLEGEFKRQKRITNRTLRAIFENKELLNPVKYPLFSFFLISHKIVKFLVPFFLVFLITFNFFLLNSGLFYNFLFYSQLIFYLFVIIGFLINRVTNKNANPFSICYHFALINIAIFLGWIRYLTGITDIIWEPERI